jgi:cytochrome P450
MAALSADPYPFFARLQAEEPVSWIDEIDMWVVTGRDDVLNVLADYETFTVVSPRSVLRRILGYNMLTTDGDEQRRLRRPFQNPFAAKTVRQTMTATVEAHAQRMIEAFADAGNADLIARFADPLALVTVCAALGLPIDDFPTMRGWYNDFNAALGNFTDDLAPEARGQAAKAAFAAYVQYHIERLRAQPGESLLSGLAAQAELSDGEIIDALRVTIFGGLETTSALLGNALWALLTHPDSRARVQSNPALLDNAIEEAFRWESPVQTCTRHTTRDVTIGGVRLEAGDTLQCLLGAANRDPRYFAQPERFEIERANADAHLGFGNGRHFCIGSALARLEAQVGLRLLFERLPAMQLAGEDRPVGHEFLSPARLRVRWDR